MMWGMGDGSSDVAHGRRPGGEEGEGVMGGAATGAAAGMGMGGGGREATDSEMYGQEGGAGAGNSANDYPASAPGPVPNGGGRGEDLGAGDLGYEAARGRGYNEELGWGQDGWEKEEVMEDQWGQDQGADDGFFGDGDFGDWS